MPAAFASATSPGNRGEVRHLAEAHCGPQKLWQAPGSTSDCHGPCDVSELAAQEGSGADPVPMSCAYQKLHPVFFSDGYGV
jgi:hypothetical protein